MPSVPLQGSLAVTLTALTSARSSPPPHGPLLRGIRPQTARHHPVDSPVTFPIPAQLPAPEELRKSSRGALQSSPAPAYLPFPPRRAARTADIRRPRPAGRSIPRTGGSPARSLCISAFSLSAPSGSSAAPGLGTPQDPATPAPRTGDRLNHRSPPTPICALPPAGRRLRARGNGHPPAGTADPGPGPR